MTRRHLGYSDRANGYAALETRFSSYNTKAEGLTGDSVADDRAKLDTLVNVTMQPDGGRLDVVGIIRLASDVTLPDNVELHFMHGAYLAPDLGKVCTILGPFDLTLRKKFGGGGTISLAGNPYVEKLYPHWFGAKADGKFSYNAAIVTGTAALTSVTPVFSAADVGKPIAVMGAGAASGTLLTTIIAFVSATAVTLGANAGTTVAGKQAAWGTDDTLPLKAAIAAAVNGISLHFPTAIYCYTATLGASVFGQTWILAQGHRDEAHAVGNVAPYAGGAILQKLGDFLGVDVTAQKVKFVGGTFRGNYDYVAAAAVGVGDAIRWRAKYGRTEDVNTCFNGRNGISLQDGADNVHYGYFHGLAEFNGQHGEAIISIAGEGLTNFNTHAFRTSRNIANGVDVAGGQYAHFLRPESSYNGGWGLNFPAGQLSTVTAPHTEGNALGSIQYACANLKIEGGALSEGDPVDVSNVDERGHWLLERIRSIGRLTVGSHLNKMHFIARGIFGAVGRMASYGFEGVAGATTYYGGMLIEQIAGTKFPFSLLLPTAATPTGVYAMTVTPVPAASDTGLLIMVNRAGVTTLSQVHVGAANSNFTANGREVWVDN